MGSNLARSPVIAALQTGSAVIELIGPLLETDRLCGVRG